ncbi:MAG: hypothetical protein IJ011_02145 [Clostridia bacterium]|nr:hypothetical protein [Clostridia bacterium]
MNDIQYALIHNWLTNAPKQPIRNFNDASVAYLKKLKDAYDSFNFCVGKGYSIDEISKSFNTFYQMIDARVMCLFGVAHRCKGVLDTAINRKATYEEYATEECFCRLHNYMFNFLTLQND